jgi:hypothetical protein
MLYVDVPTLPELRALVTARADACVSLYVPTTHQTQHVGASRIAFANQSREALGQLERSGFDKRRAAAMAAELQALGDDESFWATQAHTLAVLATPESLRTFRLATSVQPVTEVSDRFHIQPLLRAVAFPQHAFVLSLSEGAVRLVEVFADAAPVTVHVPGLPKSAADAVGRASVNNLTQNTRIANAEGQKLLLRQYARSVDAALRAVLSGREEPLILAATEPLAPIYRALNSYPALVPEGIVTSPDHLSDGDLAERARSVLDATYRAQVEEAKALVTRRAGDGRSSSDLGTVARAATYGAIELLLLDIDAVMPGTVDPDDGRVTLAAAPGPGSYGVIDEIAGRALLTGAKILAVRKADMPGGHPVAAALRYPM